MNPSGLWRGRTSDGRVGSFKFISVEVLNDDPPKSSRLRSRSRRSSMSSRGRAEEEEEEEEQEEVPTTVEQLLRKHQLQVGVRGSFASIKMFCSVLVVFVCRPTSPCSC